MRNRNENRRHAAVLMLAAVGLIISATPSLTSSGLASVQATAPSWSATLRSNGKIAFTSDRDGNREIYVMNADGTDQVRLTNNSVVDDHPTWSPDGTKIAFVSQRPSGLFAIFHMNADGTNKTEITPINFDAREPIWDAWSMSWSPDGSRIVFQERPDPSAFQNDIFIANTDGSGRHALINSPADERQPAWSPDGSRILFSKQVSDFHHNLFTVKPDGTDLRALASFNGETDLAPSWSPTGDMIAFQIFDYANFENVGVADADGSNREWFDSGSLAPDYGGRDKPQWSPDGGKIIFQVTREDIGTEIYVKNTGGTGLAQITNTTGNNFKPSWQPLAPAACPNPIDCADFFVRQQYLDFLAREPDPGGFAYWTDRLRACASTPGCDMVQARISVSGGFYYSREFYRKGYFAYRFYKASLGRKPDYSEFVPDMSSLQGLSEAEEEPSRVAFTEGWVRRQEFRQRYDSLTDEAFVDLLADTAGVSLDRGALLDKLRGGGTRAGVVRAVVESQEVSAKEFREAVVAMMYFGYLRRDYDEGGFRYWLERLDPGAPWPVIGGFVYSREYRRRFGPEDR